MSDFQAKMHQIRFPLGLRPRPAGSLQRCPDPLAVFKGSTSKGRGKGRRGEGKGRIREKRKEGKKRSGKGKGLRS